MDSFVNIQEDVRVKIEKSITNFNKCPKDRLTVSYMETRLDNLEQQWQLFYNTHVKIISEVKKSELHSSRYHKDCFYDEVEELYIQFKSTLKERIKKGKSIDDNASSPGHSNSSKEFKNFRLPEVKIPTFSGKYNEWLTFRDLFLGLIHNNSRLDDAQKLYYLKGYLTGDAEILLKNVNVTADNYRTSWEKLESMFNNKRFLANSIVKCLFNQKVLTVESASDIKNLLSTTTDCLESIKNLDIDLASFLIVHIVSEKLDKATRRAWELKVASDLSDDLPTFDELKEFLVHRFRGLENLETKDDKVPKATRSFHVIKEKSVSCAFCAGEHKISSCPQFIKESVENRRNFVLENKLCFNCLLSNHSVRLCKNTLNCHVCKRRHHSLLHTPRVVRSEIGEGGRAAHEESSSVISKDNNTAYQAEGSKSPVVSCLATGNRKTVLLSTALVKAESKNRTYRLARALLDQGSQGSFITESLVQILGLKTKSSTNKIFGVGDKGFTSRAQVILTIGSRLDPTFKLQVNAYVLKSITGLIPATKIKKVEGVLLNIHDLADPEYDTPNRIDILLGADIYTRLIRQGLKKNASETLLAQSTALGWILSGAVETEVTSNIMVTHSMVQDAEPLGTKRMVTEEETKCEELFTSTTARIKHGRYTVKLPLNNKKGGYLPHHAVACKDKVTTKVRVVSDSFCKCSNERSPNDDLTIGPASQDYLHQLTKRHKWRNKIPWPSLSVDDVVFIGEDKMSPDRWLRGRVEQKHSGPDGNPWVVTVRTQS